MFGYYDNSDKLGVHSDEGYTLLLSSFPFVRNLFPYDNSDKLGVHTDEGYTLLLSSFPFVGNLFPCVTFVLSSLWVGLFG